MASSNPDHSAPLSREEFGEFLHVFIHEIRNRLNAIGLEAADLADQLEGKMDIGRLEGQVRDCSAFLKTVRDLLAPEDAAERKSLTEVTVRLRARDLSTGS